MDSEWIVSFFSQNHRNLHHFFINVQFHLVLGSGRPGILGLVEGLAEGLAGEGVRRWGRRERGGVCDEPA